MSIRINWRLTVGDGRCPLIPTNMKQTARASLLQNLLVNRRGRSCSELPRRTIRYRRDLRRRENGPAFMKTGKNKPRVTLPLHADRPSRLPAPTNCLRNEIATELQPELVHAMTQAVGDMRRHRDAEPLETGLRSM